MTVYNKNAIPLTNSLTHPYRYHDCKDTEPLATFIYPFPAMQSLLFSKGQRDPRSSPRTPFLKVNGPLNGTVRDVDFVSYNGSHNGVRYTVFGSGCDGL